MNQLALLADWMTTWISTRLLSRLCTVSCFQNYSACCTTSFQFSLGQHFWYSSNLFGAVFACLQFSSSSISISSWSSPTPCTFLSSMLCTVFPRFHCGASRSVSLRRALYRFACVMVYVSSVVVFSCFWCLCLSFRSTSSTWTVFTFCRTFIRRSRVSWSRLFQVLFMCSIVCGDLEKDDGLDVDN